MKYTDEEVMDIISNFNVDNFDVCWNICKSNNANIIKTRKQNVKTQRAGIIAMLVFDLYKADKLTEEEKKTIGL